MASITPSQHKICKVCFKRMPNSATSDLCQACENEAKFKEVKEYLLHHVATEFEVADHFGLPLAKVREWIREGRMDYKR